MSKNKIDDLYIEAFDKFIDQFKEESDRAAIILGASKLDYLLYAICNNFLIPNYSRSDDLFDGDSPLSTFSAKINLCYRLGIIDSQFAKALHLIRKIRNDFAHETSNAKMGSSPHSDRIRELTVLISNSEMFEDVKNIYFQDKSGAVANFYTSLTMLAARLETILLKIEPLSSSKTFSIIPKNYAKKKRKSRKK